ncbi:hypothetical protein KC327_g10 [Hortaea werneckii]|nr:hypothetical protein KC327_g10 [Hortaea werneckii]
MPPRKLTSRPDSKSAELALPTTHTIRSGASTSKKNIMSTLAFFGATGDCAGYCLAQALNAGYDCRALARTPAKLTASLKNKNTFQPSKRPCPSQPTNRDTS